MTQHPKIGPILDLSWTYPVPCLCLLRHPESWQPWVSLAVTGHRSACVYAHAAELSNVAMAAMTHAPILSEVGFDIPQGNLVAVVGRCASGKSTLLKLLSGNLVPSAGNGLLFVPPHLRMLHVSHHPLIFAEMSIVENLCFGPSDGVDEEPGRVIEICSRLGMSDEVIQDR